MHKVQLYNRKASEKIKLIKWKCSIIWQSEHNQIKPRLPPCHVFYWVVRNVAFSFSVPHNNTWRVSFVPLLFQTLLLGLASSIKLWPRTQIKSDWTKEPFSLSVTAEPPTDFIISKELLKIHHTNGHTSAIQYPFTNSLWPQKSQWVPS